MRLARALLFVALSGAVAHADDAKPADAPADARPAEAHTKVPLRIVRMLPDTRQALLFDKTKGTHVVVEAGQAVEGFLVDSIDADEVTLLSDNGVLVVLAAPEPAWRHHRDDGHPTEGGNGREWRGARTADANGRMADARTADARTPRPADARTATAANPGEPQPADPYADVAEPSTIGTGADGVRVVEAPAAPAYGAAPTTGPSPVYGAAPTTAPVLTGVPSTIGTGADGVRVVEAPGAPASAAGPAAASATAPASAAATAPASAAATAPASAAGPASATAPASASATVSGSAAGPAAATVAASAAGPAAATAPASATAAAPSGDPMGNALAAALTGAPAATTAVVSTTVSAAPSASGTAAPAAGAAIVLARSDVAAALSNFGTLAGSIKGAFTPAGVRVDSVAAGSLFAKAGLRGGDVIASVDGVPLRSLDAAADLYARAATARNVSVAIVRAGQPATLRVAIQ